MHHYKFKQFQSPIEDNYPSSDTQPQFTLDDRMFKCFIHWYVVLDESIEKEKRELEGLAKQFQTVMCLWRIVTEDGRRLGLVDLKAVNDLTKLQDFLDQALKVSRPTFVNKKFRVLSICIINKFGSFEAQKCYSLCQNCGDEERLNECCGQFICVKCSKGKGQESSCPFCNKKLDVSTIPLETVEIEQAKRIYEPMFPELGLEERFQLMDMIECDFDYN